MKKLLFMLLCGVLALVFASCEKEDDGNKKPDTDAKIWVYGVDVPTGNKAMNHRNEVRRNVHDILAGDSIKIRWSDNSAILFTFADENIDLDNDRISFIAGNIGGITNNSFLTDTMAIMFDMHEDSYYDTIGYIPAEQVIAMHDKIFAIWDSEDWDEIFKVFEDGLQFHPCTGAEYRKIHGLE